MTKRIMNSTIKSIYIFIHHTDNKIVIVDFREMSP